MGELHDGLFEDGLGTWTLQDFLVILRRVQKTSYVQLHRCAFYEKRLYVMQICSRAASI